MLEKFVEDRYRKSLKECSNEEIYVALLELVRETAGTGEGKFCKEKESLLYFGKVSDWKIVVE